MSRKHGKPDYEAGIAAIDAAAEKMLAVTIPEQVVGIVQSQYADQVKQDVPLPDGFGDVKGMTATIPMPAPRSVPMWSEVTVRQTGRTA